MGSGGSRNPGSGGPFFGPWGKYYRGSFFGPRKGHFLASGGHFFLVPERLFLGSEATFLGPGSTFLGPGPFFGVLAKSWGSRDLEIDPGSKSLGSDLGLSSGSRCVVRSGYKSWSHDA